MVVPLRPEYYACVLHDADGNPISALNPLPVTAVFPPIATVSINDAFAGVTELSVKADGVAVPGTNGSALVGGKDALGNQYALLCNAAGQLIISVGAATPGATVTGVADVPVAAGPAVALPVPPAATSRATYQNTVAATVVRIREVGGVGGILLAYLGSITLGGEDGAIASMEALHVSGVASAVATLFEGP